MYAAVVLLNDQEVVQRVEAELACRCYLNAYCMTAAERVQELAKGQRIQGHSAAFVNHSQQVPIIRHCAADVVVVQAFGEQDATSRCAFQ